MTKKCFAYNMDGFIETWSCLQLDEECSAITSYYEREFFEEMLGLNMIAPSMTSRVTEYVPVIIQFVQGIIDRGHAYVGSDGI